MHFEKIIKVCNLTCIQCMTKEFKFLYYLSVFINKLIEWRFFCWDIIFQKIFLNTNNLLTFRTHPDPFISDDVCCYYYLRPHFDEAAKFTKLQYQMQGLWSTLQWCKTARKLGTRQNENRKSVQACDLKSAVSEHAKDAGHSIDWANVTIIG